MHTFQFLAYLSVLLGVAFGKSGTPGAYIPCHTDEHHEHLLHRHPHLHESFKRVEDHWRQNPNYLNKFSCSHGSCSLNHARVDPHNRFLSKLELPNPLILPINVHIVSSPNSKYIGYEQIVSQIRTLNKDFNKQNDDLTTDYHFGPMAGDFNINFVLNKIIRTKTSMQGFNARDPEEKQFMKFRSTGGSDSIDNMFALNLWIAELSGGILGFATFPGGFREEDGVVIDPQCFGNIDYKTKESKWDINAPYNLGRTTTHEIGHWLNLKHIWGEPEYVWSNGCNYDDLVSDTPVDDGPNYGCPADNDHNHLHPESCNTQDMYMNFMDYTNDNCMNMFTRGQVDRGLDLFSMDGFREYFTDYAKHPALTKFVNYFYFINKNDKCDNGHIKRELNNNKDLCMSYSNNPHIDVITNIHVINGANTECPALFEKIDTRLDNDKYICYKKGPQTVFKGKMITDLDIFQLADNNALSMLNGFILNPVSLNNGTIHLGAKTIYSPMLDINNNWCSVFDCIQNSMSSHIISKHLIFD